jgi:AraC-like DNA-binding protein
MREIYLKETQFNITYSPFFENVVKFESGQVVSTMDFHFAMSFLKRMATYFPALLNPFINRILDGQFTPFFPRPLYATAQMLSACRDILLELNRPLPNYFAIDLLVQLLFVQAISCQRDFVQGSQIILNKDIDAVHHISNLILGDLSDIKRIEQLARVAGMNEKKLKNLFKQEYGEGIYTYWLQHRLQNAREMVLDHPLMSVQEIAYEFGYSSLQSFEKAFKKMFHNTPGKLRMRF